MLKNITQSKKIIGLALIIILIIAGYSLFSKRGPTYQFISVKRGAITESISLTGNTTPTQSVSLAFGASGIISNTYSDLGKQVHAGQILAELNTNDLVAQLHQAQANVSVQKAKLEGLQSGSRPEDITLAQVALDNAKIDLENIKTQQATLVANAYRTLLNTGLVAVSNQSNNTASSITAPTISGTYTGTAEGTITINTNSGGSSGYFTTAGLVNTIGQISTTTATPLGDTGLFIQFPSDFSQNSTIVWTITIPNTQASTYVASYNAYQSALQTKTNTIASAQSAIDAAQAQLDLKRAGSTQTDISAQQAQVAQAQASVESAIAKIQNAEIIAPISGTVTQFDAKIGQLASPSVPLISIMSDTGYEVDAGVSEIDVGKVSVGDTVTMTLDAFSNETFTGSVFYVAPGETNNQGVISYLTKISFDSHDARIKSGLTANITIKTNSKEDVLILPQYAILQNDQGTFVKTLENGVVKQNQVTLGITDQEGNVEVISGTTEGQQVINIGLKQ